MKYYITTCTSDGIGITCSVNVRADAKRNTLVKRSVQTIYDELHRLGLIGENAKVHIEHPNIWVNGGVGFISMDDGERTYSVTIQREDGCLEYIG